MRLGVRQIEGAAENVAQPPPTATMASASSSLNHLQRLIRSLDGRVQNCPSMNTDGPLTQQAGDFASLGLAPARS